MKVIMSGIGLIIGIVVIKAILNVHKLKRLTALEKQYHDHMEALTTYTDT
jgi:hypothetical protein